MTDKPTARELAERVVEISGYHGRLDQQDRDDLRAAAAELTRLAEVERWATEASAKGECTLGVGDGTGNLFVHGDYYSIKAAQEIIFERDRLREALRVAAARLHDLAEAAGGGAEDTGKAWAAEAREKAEGR